MTFPLGPLRRLAGLLMPLVLFSAGCARVAPPVEAPGAATGTATALPLPVSTLVPTASPFATGEALSLGGTPGPSPAVTVATTPTATPEATATVTPTPDPYEGLYVDDLRTRAYSGGISVVQTLRVTNAYTRSLISYPSDGLTIYGFMNVPFGPGPFPVVVVNHGYISPSTYDSLTYMTRYTDPLAAAGFIAIHPDYRGYGASGSGPNPFRVGYAVDVLNLIAAVRGLPQADPDAIGLFGHSMGGGISLRTITVTDGVRAALLYGSMSGDEAANFARIAEWSGDDALPELLAPAEAVARISPINALGNVTAAVSIHHGEADLVVPPAWSADLYARLLALGKVVEYFSYPGQPHTFAGEGHGLLLERATAFFRKHLK